MRCDECRWWKRNPHSALVGECRRMPPHPADNAVDPRWWPSTRRDDWCGEFALRIPEATPNA